jgi:hypothetical protein
MVLTEEHMSEENKKQVTSEPEVIVDQASNEPNAQMTEKEPGAVSRAGARRITNVRADDELWFG